jgi:hypothetical protein
VAPVIISRRWATDALRIEILIIANLFNVNDWLETYYQQSKGTRLAT